MTSLRDPRVRVVLALALIFGGVAATTISETLGFGLVLVGLAIIYMTGIAPGGRAWRKREKT